MQQHSSRLVLRYRVYYAARHGNDLHHYEDAFALSGVIDTDRRSIRIGEGSEAAPRVQGRLEPELTWRCAIADGATEGSFSRPWAQMLAEQYVNNGPPLRPNFPGLRRWLFGLSEIWYTGRVPALLDGVPIGSPLRSRMQQSLLMDGQAATLTMFELDPVTMSWRAGSIGDSFLFHYQDGEVQPVRPFAGVRSDDLDNNPTLISTRRTYQESWIWDNDDFSLSDAYAEGNCHPGDFFFLMTDALARWFLRLLEREQAAGKAGYQDFQKEITTLLNLQDNDDFLAWLQDKRSTPEDDLNHIKNDDVTLVILEVQDREHELSDSVEFSVLQQAQMETVESPDADKKTIEDDTVDAPLFPAEERTRTRPITDLTPDEAEIISKHQTRRLDPDRQWKPAEEKKDTDAIPDEHDDDYTSTHEAEFTSRFFSDSGEAVTLEQQYQNIDRRMYRLVKKAARSEDEISNQALIAGLRALEYRYSKYELEKWSRNSRKRRTLMNLLRDFRRYGGRRNNRQHIQQFIRQLYRQYSEK